MLFWPSRTNQQQTLRGAGPVGLRKPEDREHLALGAVGSWERTDHSGRQHSVTPDGLVLILRKRLNQIQPSGRTRAARAARSTSLSLWRLHGNRHGGTSRWCCVDSRGVKSHVHMAKPRPPSVLGWPHSVCEGVLCDHGVPDGPLGGEMRTRRRSKDFCRAACGQNE